MPRRCQPEQTRLARPRSTGSAPEHAEWEIPTGNASASLPERAPQINIVPAGGQGRTATGLASQAARDQTGNRRNGCRFR